MTGLRRFPPGRAGRLWLVDRLRSGRLAATLLDRKIRILRSEQQRLRRLAEQCASRWHDSALEADRWGLRAALLGGERELRHSVPAEEADVAVEWSTIMGASYPTAASTHLPPASGTDRGPGTAALVEASAAYRTAVEAAAEHAVAQAAVRIVDAEVDATRRRLRAITDRWLPRLEAALAALTRELEEAEREEAFRLRWASNGSHAAAAGPSGG